MTSNNNNNIKIKDFSDGVQTYPPVGLGLQGQASSTFWNAHKLAFKGYQPDLSSTEDFADNGTQYDLVVAGAGISGLTTAYLYKKQNPQAKILILDCLNEVGGHCKRNEFVVVDEATKKERLLLSYGGSESFQSPEGNFSPVVNGLLKDLGIDLSKFKKGEYFKTNTYTSQGMSRGSLFAKSAGDATSPFTNKDRDVLVKGDPTDAVADDLVTLTPEQANARSFADFFNDFPMPEESRKQLIELWNTKNTAAVGEALNQEFPDDDKRMEYLASTPYPTFLKDKWKLSAPALEYFTQRTLDFFGMGAFQVATLDAHYYGFPGLQGVKGIPENEEAEAEMKEPYVYHFPDGNASICRMIVRSLIPDTFPEVPPSVDTASVPEKVLVAKMNYAALDSPTNDVRIRLESTVSNVVLPENKKEDKEDGTCTVGYLAPQAENEPEPKLFKVKAKRVVLACFNMIIPYLLRDNHGDSQVDEIKAYFEKKAAVLHKNVKAPLLYCSVVLRNWQAFKKAGVHEVFGVNNFFARIKLDYPVDIGTSYQCAKDPSEPIVVHMVHVPYKRTDSTEESEKDSETGENKYKDPRTALRGARSSFFGLGSTEKIMEKIKQDLLCLLGATGEFDFERDCLAATLNRWSHGYAWVGNSLCKDSNEQEEQRKLAAAPIGGGLITIANSDSEYSAYLHSAIDAAARAVGELKK